MFPEDDTIPPVEVSSNSIAVILCYKFIKIGKKKKRFWQFLQPH